MKTLTLNKEKPTPVALLTSVYMKIVTTRDPKSLKGMEALRTLETKLASAIMQISSENEADDILKEKLSQIDKLALAVGSPIEAITYGYRAIFNAEIDEEKHPDDEYNLFYSGCLEILLEGLKEIPCESKRDEADKLKLVPFILWEGNGEMSPLEKDCKKLIEEVATRLEVSR